MEILIASTPHVFIMDRKKYSRECRPTTLLSPWRHTSLLITNHCFIVKLADFDMYRDWFCSMFALSPHTSRHHRDCETFPCQTRNESQTRQEFLRILFNSQSSSIEIHELWWSSGSFKQNKRRMRIVMIYEITAKKIVLEIPLKVVTLTSWKFNVIAWKGLATNIETTCFVTTRSIKQAPP